MKNETQATQADATQADATQDATQAELSAVQPTTPSDVILRAAPSAVVTVACRLLYPAKHDSTLLMPGDHALPADVFAELHAAGVAEAIA